MKYFVRNLFTLSTRQSSNKNKIAGFMSVRTMTVMITVFFILFVFSSYNYLSALPMTQVERSMLLQVRHPGFGQESATRGASQSEPEIPEIPAKEEQHLTVDLSLFVSVTAFLSALTLVFALITKYLVAPTVRDIIREENQQLVMKSTFDEYKLQHQLAHEALERAIEDRK